MKPSSKLLLTGVAALALVGSAAIAASIPVMHHLTIRLPGGGTEEIAYAGTVAPKVTILPTLSSSLMMPAGAFSPVDDDSVADDNGIGFNRIFARMDAISAAMDREMAAAMQDVGSTDLPGNADGLTDATLNPSGNFCMQEVEITSTGNGDKPQVVSHTSGNCAGAKAPGAASTLQDMPGDSTPLLKTEQPLLPGADAPGRHI